MITCTHLTHVLQTHTCKDDQAVAGLSVAQHASSEQHVLVGEAVLLFSPVQGPAETIQLVVRRLTHHLPFAHGEAYGKTHTSNLDAALETHAMAETRTVLSGYEAK